MPGIVTHSRVLKESIQYLSRKDKRSYLLKSIETLFNTPENLRAGLFGAIGPDIFDHIPQRNKHNYCGSEISFFIHNGGTDKLMSSMIRKIYSYQDKNTEWAAAQRAYLYGLISHVIADSVFHPFIFYYSGFPNTYTRKEIYFFREQNLLFQHHLDNYFQYHEENASNYQFTIDEMLPLSRKRLFRKLDMPIRSFMLDAIKNSYPDIYRRLMVLNLKKSGSDHPSHASYLDLLPLLIRLVYRLKRSKSRRVLNMIRYIRRNNLFFSDSIIPYPMNRKFNKNILNLHRERWEHPAGKSGLHYESVNNLMASACEKTVELWEKIESCLYAKENLKVLDDVNINAYTGDSKLTYHDMKIKRPIRLSF
jgi:hypothetical protein